MACSLPKDAMVQILLRLPVKSLLRFRSVCKSWYNFLKSPHFIKLHLTHQIAYNRENYGCFPDLSLLHLHQIYFSNPLPLPFAIEAKDYANFEFYYNGLICLMKDIYMSPEVILWNPATRKYRCINVPSECSRFTYLKLGYVQQSNDYKLLKVPFEPRSNDEASKMAWVYTLSSGSWKTVPFTLLSLTVAWGPQISLNGFVYWLATSAVECIICFDLIKDEFKLVDIPDDRGIEREHVQRRLMVLRGSLAMMVSVEDGSRDTELWVLMNKSGVKQYSWTKKFIIEPFSKEAIPLGIWNDDKLLVVVLQTRALKQVYTYDLVTKKIDYFHVPKEEEFDSFMSVRGRYFESLELEDRYGKY
ncbi:PREDICTED: putative F-box protein At3g20705 isoform X1 [Nicotiana attenuata]|uniref:F-box protein n=2 Tax=Nicotiana attenuata TaxID=49451 RepID=A0A1J6I2K2_NICAT|nr:PREDICTED: putative F-box protein At3g20705 isoform X1 [Nicotiana attenuata]XP_019253498.1 PREDICTED: putative F-box protein At3g20705 isoform X1 [Nicotiana attenuata]OIS98753.1 putative f-box protein [Nicotiana attenuata]